MISFKHGNRHPNKLGPLLVKLVNIIISSVNIIISSCVCVVFLGLRHIIVMLHISYASAIICKSLGICVRNSPLPTLKLKAKPPILAIRFFTQNFSCETPTLKRGKKHKNTLSGLQ